MYCKTCGRKACNKYSRTLEGFIRTRFLAQKKISKARGHNPPNYTFKEFRLWMLSRKNFKPLFKKWIESGYDRNFTPSVDRLDDYKGYSFDNIQLMTWNENRAKGHRDVFTGKNRKRTITILQYTKDFIFIKEHFSGLSAERETGIFHSGINKCCRGKLKSSGDFIWRYKNEH